MLNQRWKGIDPTHLPSKPIQRYGQSSRIFFVCWILPFCHVRLTTTEISTLGLTHNLELFKMWQVRHKTMITQLMLRSQPCGQQSQEFQGTLMWVRSLLLRHQGPVSFSCPYKESPESKHSAFSRVDKGLHPQFSWDCRPQGQGLIVSRAIIGFSLQTWSSLTSCGVPSRSTNTLILL